MSLREKFIENSKNDSEFCQRYARQKNGLDFIPWSRMHSTVMGRYDGIVASHEVRFVDGPDSRTAEVEVCVQVVLGEEQSTPISTVLAVTDHRNKPIVNPTTADIQNTRQRAYAKALSMATGVGLSLWFGSI